MLRCYYCECVFQFIISYSNFLVLFSGSYSSNAPFAQIRRFTRTLIFFSRYSFHSDFFLLSVSVSVSVSLYIYLCSSKLLSILGTNTVVADATAAVVVVLFVAVAAYHNFICFSSYFWCIYSPYSIVFFTQFHLNGSLNSTITMFCMCVHNFFCLCLYWLVFLLLSRLPCLCFSVQLIFS